MKHSLRLAVIAGIAGAMLAAVPARAEKADRDKPVNIEADRVSVDDVKKVQTFEGNVQLVKGTLIIRAERIVVTQDDDGYQRGVATGTAGVLPRFRQKREGLDEYIEGEGERIEHDAKAEKTEFFNRAWVKSGLDEVRGQFISYDALTEKYFVTSGPNGTRAQPGSGERVRAVIQPKSKDGAPAAASRPATAITPTLKGAQSIAVPRQEAAQ
ncbi:MAG: lipopolysaccharide transport periplasmic protein LptA [Rhodocyclales bacterium]|jgi:lipopolysaccharide export system protein LptA|nr:lipopolysaccharide transport periplasmic protein LptA [Rhodocyclales bacterium]